jgi:hypothetical protein
MTAIIFSGPSLPPSSRPNLAGVEWWPPVRQGDLYLASLQRPALIGVTDGYFELVPTVWHKEILWAMTQGIHVYGAASIGALRAAELADFGMKGVGQVYRQFRCGELTDDDEVAVLHGPAEVDYAQVTEPMVNVRATITCARQLGVIEPALAEMLVPIAKSMFYKDRTYEAILEVAAQQGLEAGARSRFATWLARGKVDQKRIDAEEMLKAMLSHLAAGPAALHVSYRFAHTFAWEEARRRAETAADPKAHSRSHQASDTTAVARDASTSSNEESALKYYSIRTDLSGL